MSDTVWGKLPGAQYPLPPLPPPGVERDGYALIWRRSTGAVERIVMCVELQRDGAPWVSFPVPHGGEPSPYFLLMRLFADSWQYRSTSYRIVEPKEASE